MNNSSKTAKTACRTALLLWAAAQGGLELTGGETGAAREPVFIGVQGCSECHVGERMGHQFSKWRLSAHAGAYASLAAPEAKAITELSGIPEEPWEAKMCLGCHATGADVDEWERDEAFHVEDGMQCEACHGAGSEYAFTEIMTDRGKAMAHGLKMPKREDCRRCHRVKGSHEAVLDKKPFDPNRAWRAIAHPIPYEESRSVEAETPAPKVSSGPHRYTGVMACAKCHRGPDRGFQFSKWREGPHARAYALLATERGYALARESGVAGDPQQSAQCLSCHSTGAEFDEESFRPGFNVREGVQCESCHGPGSSYSPEAIMLDPTAARNGGLLEVNEETCQRCHEDAHDKPFHYDEAVRAIRHPSKLGEYAEADRYKTPLNLALTPDGRELWVTCEASDTVIIVDARRCRKIAELQIGGQPTDVTFDPEGRRAFISNRLDDNVAVVDVANRRIEAKLTVGDEPHGVLLDSKGKHLYVLNTSIDSISVFDARSLKEVKRLSASRSPWSMARSPDGKLIFVTNTLSRFGEMRTPSLSEITVIDTDRAIVTDRYLAPAANLLQGVAWHPSGDYAVITLNRTKNLVPMTRLLQGWTITNGIGIVWRDGAVDQILLDQPNLCFPDPADVTITPDGKYALVTSSGSHRVAVVDLARLISMLEAATPHERERVYPNHLGKPVEFVLKFLETGASPRGIVCSPDGKVAFVANALDDSITTIDLTRLEVTGTIDLGGPRHDTKARQGEKLFHSANITFRRQFSCHTCHPDGHIDGITYDIEPDGIGVSPVDNRTLRGINDMAPYKWEGTNPTLKRQCGPRLAVFFTRIQPFTPEQLDALDTYICTIPRPPNRYRGRDAPLTPAQRRGRKMFERAYTNAGRMIPVEGRCATCHPPPLFTDGRRHDVGARHPLDREVLFDAPHLSNIYDSAPYLHNGMAQTLEEIWTRFNPYDEHGVTNDMTKDQLNDLIEYLKTL